MTCNSYISHRRNYMLILKLSKKMWKKNLRCFRSVWYCCCCWYCFCLDACGVRPNALFGSGFKGKRLVELYNEQVLRWKKNGHFTPEIIRISNGLPWSVEPTVPKDSIEFGSGSPSLWVISAFMISFKGIYNFKIAHFFILTQAESDMDLDTKSSSVRNRLWLKV